MANHEHAKRPNGQASETAPPEATSHGCFRKAQRMAELIREALGRAERQQAQRLGISGATLHKSEQSEAEDRITLRQLRKLADGLDCELVYALVPRRPLTDVVQERARAIAMEEVAGVAHTMSLEEQRPGAERLRKQVERRTDELLRGRWSNLWR